jgi:tripartite-type tricarboxylate transporter receptor subunit TctC
MKQKTLLATLTGVLLSSFAIITFAQSFPNRPVKIIVPYAPGGADIQIRGMVPLLSEALGQSVVIETRDGGGTVVGSLAVKNAPPDGHTLLFTNTTAFAILQLGKKTSRFAPEDFVPIGNVTGTPLVLAINAEAPYKTLPEFLAYAKANPGKINMGTAGIGTSTHMVGEAFQAIADVKLTHVPFKGVSGALQGILGGFSDVVFALPGAVAPHVHAGKIRVIATLDKKRSAFFPNSPTALELGLNSVELSRFGVFAPKGIPVATQQKLVEALKRATENTDYRDAMAKSYTDSLYLSPNDLSAAILGETKYWGALLQTPRLAEVLEK